MAAACACAWSLPAAGDVSRARLAGAAAGVARDGVVDREAGSARVVGRAQPARRPSQPALVRRGFPPGPLRPFPRPSSTGSSRGAGLLGLLRGNLGFREEALEELELVAFERRIGDDGGTQEDD